MQTDRELLNVLLWHCPNGAGLAGANNVNINLANRPAILIPQPFLVQTNRMRRLFAAGNVVILPS
jgi:hypothetical protein